jgi:TolA-binding protein
MCAGCAGPPDPDGSRSAPPAYEIRRQQALCLFEDGEYDACTRALESWLQRYESDHPDPAASARFFIGLCYLKMNDLEKAKAAFEDVARRYADAPDTGPAAKWRRWAQEELNSREWPIPKPE